MEKSLTFYRDGLGFQLKNKWEPRGTIEWCWLELGSAAIMLQEYRDKTGKQNLGMGVSICFTCADALKIYDQIMSRGLAPSEPFVGNYMWVVALEDPDGYKIYFESPTTVPEETTYSEWLNQNKQSN